MSDETEASTEVPAEWYIPNLSGVAKPVDVQTKGGSQNADYINWSKTMQHVRENAPGWVPEAVPPRHGTDIVHKAPDGSGYLMIRFTNVNTGRITTAVPHAIMDNRNNAKSKVDCRDVTDAFVRGTCKAAALLFGLAWEMWSKTDPLTEGRPDPVPVSAPPVDEALPAQPPTPETYIGKAKNYLGTCSNSKQVLALVRRLATNRDLVIEAGEWEPCRVAIIGRCEELSVPKDIIQSFMDLMVPST